MKNQPGGGEGRCGQRPNLGRCQATVNQNKVDVLGNKPSGPKGLCSHPEIKQGVELEHSVSSEFPLCVRVKTSPFTFVSCGQVVGTDHCEGLGLVEEPNATTIITLYNATHRSEGH